MMKRFLQATAVLAVAISIQGCQRPWLSSPAIGTTGVPVDSTLLADPELERQIAPYRQQVTEKMSEVVGTAPVALGKGAYESPLGNFVTALQRSQSEPLYGKTIDLSLTTDGGLRVPLPAGNITTGHVFELMPFENELVVLTLTGETVRQLFEFAAERKYVYLGNASYTVARGKATNISINGTPLDTSRTYTLVTSNYLAGGGDNLNMLKNPLKYEQVGLMLRDAILQQIRQLTAAGKAVQADTTAHVTLLP